MKRASLLLRSSCLAAGTRLRLVSALCQFALWTTHGEIFPLRSMIGRVVGHKDATVNHRTGRNAKQNRGTIGMCSYYSTDPPSLRGLH